MCSCASQSICTSVFISASVSTSVALKHSLSPLPSSSSSSSCYCCSSACMHALHLPGEQASIFQRRLLFRVLIPTSCHNVIQQTAACMHACMQRKPTHTTIRASSSVSRKHVTLSVSLPWNGEQCMLHVSDASSRSALLSRSRVRPRVFCAQSASDS